ncbi:MAG TPA: glycosyltransferase family 39 protein [Planctomycetota bacterium]|nr:glycosyltransferase family 39 protein [Planctomycetota bacterium]
MPTPPTAASAAALALLALALALPPAACAEAVAGGDPGRLGVVEAGVWSSKLALAVSAALLWGAGRLARRGRSGAPLLRRGLREPERATAREHVAIRLLLAVALALRLHELGAGLWYDEIDTLVNHVRLPLAEVATTFQSKNQHFLYSVLARVSLVVFGESAWALRLPAALLGVASLYATWRLGRLLAPPIEALLASALLAFSYQHLWFSQNARGYTGMLLFTLAGTAALLRLLAARDGAAAVRGSLAYGAWMALAVAVHLTSLFTIAAHGLIWLALLARSRGRGRGGSPAARPLVLETCLAFAATAAFSVLLYAPVLPQFAGTALAPLPGAPTQWRAPQWFVIETLSGLARGVPGGWAALALAFLVGGAGVWSYLRQGPWVLAVLLAPAAVSGAAVFVLEHNLWPRDFFFSAGFFALLAIRGIRETARALARTWGGAGAEALARSAALLACAAAALAMPRAWGPKQDFEGALRFVRESAAPGDAVVTVLTASLPFEELHRAGWSDAGSLEELMDAERRHPRTWLVYTMPTLLRAWQPGIWERIQSEYSVVRSFPGSVGDGDIVISVHPPRSPAAGGPPGDV